MLRKSVIVVFSIVFALTIGAQCEERTETQLLELRQRLARDKGATYIKTVDPGKTTIYLGLSLVSADYNPTTNVLTSRVFERYIWVDKRTAWEESDYGGVKTAIIPASKLWTPDIRLFNVHDEEPKRGDRNVIIFSNGTVFWNPPAIYKTHCTRSKPAPGKKEGTISCQLHLGAWTYNGDDMRLERFEDGVDTFHFLSTCPYVISNPTAVLTDRFYPCCPEAFPTLDINFDIHPRPVSEYDEDGRLRNPGWLDVTALTPTKAKRQGGEDVVRKSGWLDVRSSSPKAKHHETATHGPRKPRCFWPNCPD
jgi:hypothetical protein